MALVVALLVELWTEEPRVSGSNAAANQTSWFIWNMSRIVLLDIKLAAPILSWTAQISKCKPIRNVALEKRSCKLLVYCNLLHVGSRLGGKGFESHLKGIFTLIVPLKLTQWGSISPRWQHLSQTIQCCCVLNFLKNFYQGKRVFFHPG